MAHGDSRRYDRGRHEPQPIVSVEAAQRTMFEAVRPAVSTTVDVDPHHGQPIVSHGYTVLLSNPDGSITDSRQGLFDHDTRVLSSYEVLLDGVRPSVDSSGLIDSTQWIARLTVARSGGEAKGPALPQDALELTLHRRIGNGMHETMEITNHSAIAADTSCVVRIDADFCDIGEVGGTPEPLGNSTSAWDEASRAFTIDYHAANEERTLHRALRVRVTRCDTAPAYHARALTFAVTLGPRASWRAELAYEVLVDGRWRSPITDEPILVSRRQIGTRWEHDRARLESEPSSFASIVERAADDLSALRNWEYDVEPDGWIPNAGVPTYTGLFGRDTLTAGWQAALMGPEMLRGALANLAATQATFDSAWHDAEPGKMVHEIRRGPLSELNVIPQQHYYGTQTSSSFFVVALSELWHWTGDTALLRRYLDSALRTFDWAQRFGDRDGDGFLEYVRRSARGLKNHAWKDSDEAIRYPNGELVPNPIATVEEQAFHWLALQRMAEILVALGEDGRSEDFLQRARTLRADWQRAFWVPEDGYYAMAIDPAKRPVRSIGSNAGHALAAGLVPIDLALRVADRMMAPDLFSGWGIRTLSSDHPSYNPLAYHLGTVWPAEQATFVLGFKRYGLEAHVERLTTAMFEAADQFRHGRLPEALGGHARAQAPIPTVYPASNSPQTWSASATIQMAQTLLGIYPFAPAHLLTLVRPSLPSWLRVVVVRNIRVGPSRVSLRFERTPDGRTTYTVLEKTGPLHVIEVASPQQHDGLGWRDELSQWLLEHAPGRTAAALRIALGTAA